ncbi:MAG TPA: menaquinone biosynthesis decarboxylase [Chthonomonadaceae bacterium]|nr:menaquinone biosynthesis decarboxylase [Chthonomonadaceae bacterium]
MAYNDFQDFLARLESEGELKRIRVPVDPYLEITEVADRVMKRPDGGPALLFEQPTGKNIPLAINVFGSRKRMSLALGAPDIEEIACEIESLLKPEVPTGLLNAARDLLPKLGVLARMPPRHDKGDGRCQEVVLTGDDVDLDKFPILHCWPQDGGRYITLPLVFTHDPNTGKRNVGMYRVQVFDKRTTAMHWQLHKVGAEHARLSAEQRKKIDVCVALGGDPALTYAATAPLPPGIDEMLFAGFLRKKPVHLVKAKTVDIEVPEDAEIVIEGQIDPTELRMEGPFGDHTGYYSLADMYPVLHITAITHRRNPVYPATIVGRPPMEDGWLGKATERLFLPLLRLTLPEVVDMNLPVEGIFHNIALVSIKKRYPGHAFKVMHALWGLGQAMFTKMIFIFDHDVNVQDVKECLWRLGNNIDPERDMCLVRGPIDVLDHASRALGFGSKIGFDCTRKLPAEGFAREWPDVITMSSDVKARIDGLWNQLGL